MLQLATLDRLRAMLSACEHVRIRLNCGGLQLLLRWDLRMLVLVGPAFLHTSPTWKLSHWTEIEPSLGVCVSRATSQSPGLQGLTNVYASNIMIHSFTLQRLGNQRLLAGCSFQ
jgi:hypothetical protein